MLPLSTVPWDQIRTTPLTHHLKSCGGNLTSPEGETPGDHLQEGEEEDNHHVPRDHPQEEAGEEVGEEAEEEEEEEEHSHFPGKHLLILLKNFWETHLQFSQEIEPR